MEINIYTIGHGKHARKDFPAPLQKYEIAFLCVIFLKRFLMLDKFYM
jgi:hypothetical protein